MIAATILFRGSFSSASYVYPRKDIPMVANDPVYQGCSRIYLTMTWPLNASVRNGCYIPWEL